MYVRLFLRKHHWMRKSKLSYRDIADDLTDIIHALTIEGFLADSECYCTNYLIKKNASVSIYLLEGVSLGER